MTNCLIDFFKKQDVEYKEFFKISDISSIGIGGIARYALYPNTVQKLIRSVDYLNSRGVSFRVVGRMTNILSVSDVYDGVLILTNKLDRYCVAENTVSAECGVPLSKLIREMIKYDLGGAEALYGIPGSVGGAVFGNAGAFGLEISDIFISARIYRYDVGRTVILDKEQMSFSYRHSALEDIPALLLDAQIAFSRSDPALIKSRISDILAKRKSSQPYGELTLGSIFKRDEDLPISRLIDELGLKGFSVGGAKISEKHAGFIVNFGGASASDVLSLIKQVKEKLYSSYGIVAKEEIKYLS